MTSSCILAQFGDKCSAICSSFWHKNNNSWKFRILFSEYQFATFKYCLLCLVLSVFIHLMSGKIFIEIGEWENMYCVVITVSCHFCHYISPEMYETQACVVAGLCWLRVTLDTFLPEQITKYKLIGVTIWTGLKAWLLTPITGIIRLQYEAEIGTNYHKTWWLLIYQRHRCQFSLIYANPCWGQFSTVKIIHTFSVIFQDWNGACSWNPSPRNSCLSCMVNTMAANGLTPVYYHQ